MKSFLDVMLYRTFMGRKGIQKPKMETDSHHNTVVDGIQPA
jgi:hypothetical protein